MDFNFTEEQTMLADMVGKLFEREHDSRLRRRRLSGETQAIGGLWPSLRDLGILALHVPEEHGGMAGSAEDRAAATHIVAKAMGRTLALEPFVSCAVVCSSLLADVGTEAQKGTLLPKIAGGSTTIALAHSEAGHGDNLAWARTTATAGKGGYHLKGRKCAVLDAGAAQHFIVSARTSGQEGDEAGLNLFLVDLGTAGLRVDHRVSFDGGDVGELHLDDVWLPADRLLGAPGQGFAPMQHAIHRGMAALLSEAVGAMERLLELSIEYLKTRKQFGQPLAKFQALQHGVADMATALEQAHSMALLAVAASTQDDVFERARKVSAAKSLVGRVGLQLGKQAVQLHGGIGMTDELAVGHYFRRLMAINATWGDAQAHLASYADSLLPGESGPRGGDQSSAGGKLAA